jgi:asparagine synthase (glutamine-hydrolysing)
MLHNEESGELVVAAGGSVGSGAAYHLLPDGITVATSLPALFALLPSWPALDERALALLAMMMPGGTAPYQGVEILGYGKLMTAVPQRSGPPRVSTHRWFQPEDVERVTDFEPFVEQYLALLDACVAAELPANGDVGALMSAGLDSTMVAASAAQVIGPNRRVRAMCLDPLPGAERRSRPGWVASDLSDARAMEQRWRNLDVLPLDNPERLTPFDTLPPRFDETFMPFTNPGNGVWIDLALRRSAAAGTQVLLNGASGNATFSYSPPNSLALLLRAQGPGHVIDAIREMARTRGHSVGAVLPGVVASLGATSPTMRRLLVMAGRARERLALGDRPSQAGPIITSDALRRLGLVDQVVKSPFASRPPQLRHEFGPAVRRFWDAQALTRVMWGVRQSDPLASAPLVELVSSLPDEAFVGVGTGRSWARRTMAGRVPDSIRLRRVRGAQSADRVQWYRRLPDAQARIAELAAVPGVAELVDMDRVARQYASMECDEGPWLREGERGLGLALFMEWAGRRRMGTSQPPR